VSGAGKCTITKKPKKSQKKMEAVTCDAGHRRLSGAMGRVPLGRLFYIAKS
jgi:hypothetical protein